MSALANTELAKTFGALAEVKPLETDLYLEHEYGHLNPQELLESELGQQEKQRIVALQIAALHIVPHNMTELHEWIQCDQVITGDNSYQYT